MKTFKLGIAGTLAAIAIVSTGCSDIGIGRKCLAPGMVSATQISSPALECMSRLCFLKADSSNLIERSVCTAHCASDADCASGLIPNANDPNSTGLCTSKFVCAVATIVDTYQCQTLCICQDDLVKGFNADTTTGNACWPQKCSSGTLMRPASLNPC